MGIFTRSTDALREEVAGLRGDIRAFTEERKAASKALELTETIVELETQISSLKADRSRIEEGYAREKREALEAQERTKRDTEHMLGLHKKQVAQEISSSKRETAIEVREDNLAEEKKRFERDMKFQREEMASQVTYLQSLMAQVLERLPAIEIGGNLRFTDNGDSNGRTTEEV